MSFSDKTMIYSSSTYSCTPMKSLQEYYESFNKTDEIFQSDNSSEFLSFYMNITDNDTSIEHLMNPDPSFNEAIKDFNIFENQLDKEELYPLANHINDDITPLINFTDAFCSQQSLTYTSLECPQVDLNNIEIMHEVKETPTEILEISIPTVIQLENIKHEELPKTEYTECRRSRGRPKTSIRKHEMMEKEAERSNNKKVLRVIRNNKASKIYRDNKSLKRMQLDENLERQKKRNRDLLILSQKLEDKISQLKIMLQHAKDTFI